MKGRLLRTSLGLFAILAEMAAPAPAGAQILQAESKSIHSEILGEDRTVFVSLPNSYSRGTDRYPVVYLTDASEGEEMQSNVEALLSVLSQRADSSVRWASRSYPDETHDAVVLKSFYDGLRMIFDDYEYPRHPETYLLMGSLADMNAHYSSFGARLGVPFGTPEGLVNELAEAQRDPNLDTYRKRLRVSRP